MTEPKARRSGSIRLVESLEEAQRKFRQPQDEFAFVIEERIRVIEEEKRRFDLQLQKKVAAVKEQAVGILNPEMQGRLVPH